MSPHPETFGKYQFIDRVAVGGMAEVFLATVHGEAGFTKPVIIKRLHERYWDDEALVQMFVDEARLTAQLMHGNICQVLDLGTVDGAFFMAMEYIAGEDVRTLQDYARRQGMVMPIEAAVFITCEVLAGLDYALRKQDSAGNSLQIIHRDISPQNILISYEGEVKVIDFGIAKARTRAVQTEAGVIKGKFRYMSPEQASGKELDHRSDLFSTAVVLYELLIGEPHSIELPDTEILYRIRQADFEPVRKRRKEVPAKLEKILKKALKREADRRYSTAADFRSDLLDLAQKYKWRFGNVEMSQVMQGVFDEERRRRRDHSWTGEMNHDSSSVSGSFRRPARRPVMDLSQQHLEDVSQHGQRGQAPGSALDDVPTRAINTGTGSRQAAPTLPPPGPPQQQMLQQPPPPPQQQLPPQQQVQRQHQQQPQQQQQPQHQQQLQQQQQQQHQQQQQQQLQQQQQQHQQQPPHQQQQQLQPPPQQPSAPQQGKRRGGAFSRGEDLPAPVKKPEITSLAAAASSPSSAVTPVPERVATVERHTPPVRGEGSGLRTLLGTLVVLLLGAGLVFWLYTTNPEFLGLEPVTVERRSAPAPAPAPRRLEPEKPATTPKPSPSGKGLVRIRSNPPGARIYMCGKYTGKKTPGQVRIRKGQRQCTIKLTIKGHEPYSMPAPDYSPRPMTLVASLRPRGKPLAPPLGAKPPRPARGTLRVTSIQPGAVIVNGQKVGQTPRLELKLRPGTYNVSVRFSSLGTESARRTVKVVAGRLTTVHLDSE